MKPACDKRDCTAVTLLLTGKVTQINASNAYGTEALIETLISHGLFHKAVGISYHNSIKLHNDW
jgi:hypothetical protein